jgi:2-methylfumaryl-CoA isomerase
MDGTNRGLPGLPWRWPNGERSTQTAAPELGEHTDAVLSEVLGMSDAEIATLRDDGSLT